MVCHVCPVKRVFQKRQRRRTMAGVMFHDEQTTWPQQPQRSVDNRAWSGETVRSTEQRDSRFVPYDFWVKCASRAGWHVRRVRDQHINGAVEVMKCVDGVRQIQRYVR